MYSWVARLCACLTLAVLGCSEGTDLSLTEPIPQDLEPYESGEGKFDGYGFDPHFLIEDDVFVDAEFLSTDDLQVFFEATPYGKRSFLATYTVDGISAAEMIKGAATEWQINPLVLLVKLQVETSLVFEHEIPTQHRIDRAMGCGCPDDDPSCSGAPRGLRGQIDCAARVFRAYLTELQQGRQTRSGWRVDRSKNTLDPQSVRPRNAATAALYTYTPWVLTRQGGNWLFWNVFQRFARSLLESKPNHRFIGGACVSDEDCQYADGICVGLPSTGGETGFCSKPCERTCPDRKQPHTAITFCGATDEGGFCYARCRTQANVNACFSGLECSSVERQGQPDTVQDICTP